MNSLAFINYIHFTDLYEYLVISGFLQHFYVFTYTNYILMVESFSYLIFDMVETEIIHVYKRNDYGKMFRHTG